MAWCVACVCRAVLQTDGATPLYIASQIGHVECMRALLDGGAAINQAMVGCGRPRHRGGYFRGDPWRLCRVHVSLWLHSARWSAWARSGPGLEGVGSILAIRFGTRVTEVVRRGMMCG